MKIYDQHVHTSLSHDCMEDMENYFKILKEKQINNFVCTEHLEISSISPSHDIIPDFKLQQQQLKSLGGKYDINTFMGVEVGYRKSVQNKIEQVLDSQPFDCVLLAIHTDEAIEITSKEFQKGLDAEGLYNKYLQLYINAVSNFKNYDVIAHVDFIIRYINEKPIIENHRPKLSELFNILVKDGKTLELNTRFFYRGIQPESVAHLHTILEIYKECGGEYISIGSDCHMIKDFYAGFDEALALLKSKGFNSVRYFQNRQPIDVTI